MFENGPKLKNSINLEFDTDTAIGQGYTARVEEELFEILLIVSFYGIKRLFNKDDILTITEHEYMTLNEYLASIGYKCLCLVNDTNLDPWTFFKYDSDKPILNYNITFERVI
jgi:hypothetical protein